MDKLDEKKELWVISVGVMLVLNSYDLKHH